jgi:hypothetical protein
MDTVTSQPQETAAAIVSGLATDAQAKATGGIQGTEIHQDKAPEVKAEEKKTEEPKEPLSSRFALLARREKELVQRDKDLKSKEAQYAEWQKEKAALEQSKREEDELWQTNPFEALKRRGLSYQKLTELQLNDEKPTPDLIAKKVARDELEAYKKEQQELAKKKADEDAERAKKEAEEAYNNTLTQFREETKAFVTSHTDDYELIGLHADDGIETVLATIELHFQETSKAGNPRVLSIKEACDLVEKHFEDEAKKLIATKKLQAKASPQPEADKAQSETAKPRTTLNNNMTSSATTPTRRLSWEDRVKRAMSVQV